MSDHYGKRLSDVPFSHLRTGMKVISIQYGAGTISELESKQPNWDDHRVSIDWNGDYPGPSIRYHQMFSDTVFAEQLDGKAKHRTPNPEDSLTVPHTYGGFRSVFYVTNKRQPTEQEIFDAGMRGGRDIQWAEKHAVMGHLHPEGLSPEQKVVALAGNVRIALLAFKRIMEGHEDPAKYAELTIKHLDTPSSKHLISNEISIEDVEKMMDDILIERNQQPSSTPNNETRYHGVRLSELGKLIERVLVRSKV